MTLTIHDVCEIDAGPVDDLEPYGWVRVLEVKTRYQGTVEVVLFSEGHQVAGAEKGLEIKEGNHGQDSTVDQSSTEGRG